MGEDLKLPVPLVLRRSVGDQPLEDTDELLELSEREGLSDRQRHLLLGTAVILLAVGLERAMESALTSWAKMIAESHPDDPAAFERLLTGSTRTKMMNTPRLLSRGTCDLRRSSPHLRVLHTLISTRNKLVHLRDDIFDYRTVSLGTPLPETGIVINVSEDQGDVPEGFVRLEVKVSTHTDAQEPWQGIEREFVIAARNAVAAYRRECLVEWGDVLMPGELLEEV